ADFGPRDSPGNAGFPWVEFSPCGLAGHRKRGYIPRDALFDPCAWELTDRLRRRFQPAHYAPRLHLVARGFRSGDRLFRLHLATLCGKSQRQACPPGFFLEIVIRLASDSRKYSGSPASLISRVLTSA